MDIIYAFVYNFTKKKIKKFDTLLIIQDQTICILILHSLNSDNLL